MLKQPVQSRPSSAKPVSKTFVIIIVAVAALAVLGVLVLLNTEFVGKAIQLQAQEPTPTLKISAICGNGVKEGNEQCDDGNTANGDGCSSTCLTEEVSVSQVGDVVLQGGDILTADGLRVVVEVPGKVEAGKPFLADVYAISFAKGTIGNTDLELKSSDWNIASFTEKGIVTNALFKDAVFNFNTILNPQVGLLHALPASPVSVPLNTKVYLGSFQMQTIYPGKSTISLAEFGGIEYSLNNKYKLFMNPVTICVSKTTAQCVLPACGKYVIDDGCGGKVDCTGGVLCAEGSVCVPNEGCVSAVSKVLPANAPSYDQNVLNQISNTLKDMNLNKLQKLAAIVNAVKAWLAAQ